MEEIMLFEIFVLIITFGAIALIVIWTLVTGSPPTPTSPRVRDSMIAILPSRLPYFPNGTVYELGAGWGGISRALADHFHSCQIVGIEISPVPFAFAWLRNVLTPKSNLRVSYGNFFKADLSDAALVVCYQSRDILIKLTPKLERELLPGALVISNTFEIPGWNVLDTQKAQDLFRSPIYLYERSDAVLRRSHS